MAFSSGLRAARLLVLHGCCLACAAFAADLDVLAVDAGRQPVGGARVQLLSGTAVAYSAVTGADGHARFTRVNPAHYGLAAERDGFEPARRDDLDLTGSAAVSLDLTLAPALARHESVEVSDKVSPLDEEHSAGGAGVPPQAVKELPGRPATVADALPMVPGVLRRPGGGLVISAAGEHRSAMVVNSADVTDPATGQFGLTVPIDVVESMNVYQTPFLAEYGRFTAGIVSVETRRGGDKFKWELNDPFPDFRIRSYHLRGLRDATPRLNLEGPLIEGKLYFSEGVDYIIRKTEVFELPFPYNEKKQQGVNSFTQLDWIASSTQLVTATVHAAPQRLDYANMDYFNPRPTTPQAGTKNYTGTLAHKWTLFGGILDDTFSFTRFDAQVWGQGQQDFTMAPQGNSGSYFAQQNRRASRIGWAPTYATASLHRLGTHNFKFGASLARSTDHGQIDERPVNLADASGQLLERITFAPGQGFHMHDAEFAAFGQDHWLLTPKLALDFGIRAESQQVSDALRVAPRAGIAWTPVARTGTVIRAGYGLFYDRLPLNVYSFAAYPAQTVSYFNPAGQLTAGPFLYQNQLGTVTARFPFVFQEQDPGNFSPRSATASIQIEQPVNAHLKLRAGYMRNRSDGLVLLNRVAPDPVTNTGTNLLTGNGQARYQQFEITARVRWSDTRQLFFSYVRSHARGDLNDFATFLGTFAVPILRNNQFGNLPADLPNRFLAWGLVQLPWGFRVAPLIEMRSGFPYSALDASQNWVGAPNSRRFPDFISVDSRFSKDFKVNPKYTVRLSVSSYNLTNHFNPEAVHPNEADPAYGFFFGQRGRFFTADFDVLF
ncbi:MAG: TonB-dependent receptor [Acidobacteria bacterium]|nr:TonB-dependent receptor [Acidobacteriota bacterium]